MRRPQPMLAIPTIKLVTDFEPALLLLGVDSQGSGQSHVTVFAALQSSPHEATLGACPVAPE